MARRRLDAELLDEPLPPDLERLRGLAQTMDAAVELPVVRVRVGVDALLGLVPGLGDVASATVAGSIVLAAVRHRVPAWVVARMLANVAIDAVGGALPLVGDVFDALYKANLRNLRLLLEHRDRARPPRAAPAAVGAVVVSLAVVIGGSAAALGALVVALVLRLVG